jgi:hypothetical protein
VGLQAMVITSISLKSDGTLSVKSERAIWLSELM